MKWKVLFLFWSSLVHAAPEVYVDEFKVDLAEFKSVGVATPYGFKSFYFHTLVRDSSGKILRRARDQVLSDEFKHGTQDIKLTELPEGSYSLTVLVYYGVYPWEHLIASMVDLPIEKLRSSKVSFKGLKKGVEVSIGANGLSALSKNTPVDRLNRFVGLDIYQQGHQGLNRLQTALEEGHKFTNALKKPDLEAARKTLEDWILGHNGRSFDISFHLIDQNQRKVSSHSNLDHYPRIFTRFDVGDYLEAATDEERQAMVVHRILADPPFDFGNSDTGPVSDFLKGSSNDEMIPERRDYLDLGKEIRDSAVAFVRDGTWPETPSPPKRQSREDENERKMNWGAEEITALYKVWQLEIENRKFEGTVFFTSSAAHAEVRLKNIEATGDIVVLVDGGGAYSYIELENVKAQNIILAGAANGPVVFRYRGQIEVEGNLYRFRGFHRSFQEQGRSCVTSLSLWDDILSRDKNQYVSQAENVLWELSGRKPLGLGDFQLLR